MDDFFLTVEFFITVAAAYYLTISVVDYWKLGRELRIMEKFSNEARDIHIANWDKQNNGGRSLLIFSLSLAWLLGVVFL